MNKPETKPDAKRRSSGRITLSDVAKAAEVSPITASRALRGERGARHGQDTAGSLQAHPLRPGPRRAPGEGERIARRVGVCEHEPGGHPA